MRYKIDTDIPAPKDRSLGNRKYPFADMPIGASFFVPGAHPKQLIAAARNYKPKRFTTRALIERDENGHEVKGVRVWRFE